MHRYLPVRTVLSGLFLLCLLSMPLAACGGSSGSPAPSSNGPVTITFWSWVPHIQDQVALFQQAHPNIKVNYVNAGAGNAAYAKLNVALKAKSGLPDVVQLEYQYVPTYIANGSLLDISPYGANDVKDQFVPWTWSQVSNGNAVYAIPQDSGPMGMVYRQDILAKYHLAVPQTWDQFAQESIALHKANPDIYLTNFTVDQGHFFGLLWQSGAHPFTVNGTHVTINLTSPEAMRVAKFWGDLIAAGAVSPINTYTNDWFTALDQGKIASWTAGAWAPQLIESSAKDTAGKWQVAEMPQWTAGAHANGNYGGSSDAVLKSSQHPKEAAEFAMWLNTAKSSVSGMVQEAFLFPVTTSTLTSPDFISASSSFFGGQKVNQTYADLSKNVSQDFQWSPFQNFVYTTWGDQLTEALNKKITFEQALQNTQDKVVSYAKDQGFTVDS